MTNTITQIDGSILLFIQNHIRTPALDWLMKLASAVGDSGIIWIVLGLALLFWSKTRRGGLDTLLSLAVSTAINNLIIKPLAARPRPFLTFEELEVIIKPLASYSFPSGHACASFAAAFALTHAFKGRGGAWAYIPAVLITVSRIYVGIHYPTDILAGAILGTASAWIVCRLSQKYITKPPHLKDLNN